MTFLTTPWIKPYRNDDWDKVYGFDYMDRETCWGFPLPVGFLLAAGLSSVWSHCLNTVTADSKASGFPSDAERG